MKRIALVTGSLVLIASVVVLAYSWASSRAGWVADNGTSIPIAQVTATPTADAPLAEVAKRLERAGITVEISPSPPRVEREAAIETARKSLPVEPNSSLVATHALATRVNTNEGSASALQAQARPVWVVSFLRGTSTISGPASSPLPRQVEAFTDALVDSDSGTLVLVIEDSRAPVTQPSTDDCNVVTC